MIRKRVGRVVAVLEQRSGLSRLRVDAAGSEAAAVNYHDLTGPAEPGDLVLLNNTALHLGLGTGGVDFVYHNFSRPLPSFPPGGHIMKMRYAPGQVKVLSCEEKEAGYRKKLESFTGLAGMPVLIGELHSMIAPAAAVIKYFRPACRLVYIMSDGGALPLVFSRTVAELKDKKVLDGTITCGHAFGGDLEAVNLYSALVAARAVLQADLALISMGPGHTGTGTRYGFSGMEVGEHVNRVNAMGGTPVVIPRLGFADARRRHRGVSHHTLTALAVAACSPACVVLPAVCRSRLRFLVGQLVERGLLRRHRVQVRQAPPVAEIMERLGLTPGETMGRRYLEEPLFFDAAGAAALAALGLLKPGEKLKKYKEAVGNGEAAGRNPVDKLPLPGADYQCAPGPGTPAKR